MRNGNFIGKTCPLLIPLLHVQKYIVKMGFTWGNHFIISVTKHRLWVLVRIDSLKRF